MNLQSQYTNTNAQVNGVVVNKAQGMILKSLEALEPGEKENILNKMQGAETSDIAEQNQVIVRGRSHITSAAITRQGNLEC